MAPPTSRSALSWLVSLTAICGSMAASSATPSSKRGLVFTPNATHPNDNYIWTRQPSDLTWYYNYGASPSSVYSNLSQSDFEFVPMLWGAPSSASDVTFLNTVKGLVTGGRNITHVMTFNEPDGTSATGGSDVDPTMAAKVWISNIVPLQQMGIKVGLPACTGGWGGIPWLDQFLGNCSLLISESTGGKTKNCTYDFVPLHWYGNFEGLASHIGQYYATFNASTEIWVTEYNYDNQDLPTTQAFFNSSAEYMDSLSYVQRYSIFAAFRSDASNIGPNASMLSSGGQLTDIGAWYLGRAETGVNPTDTASSGAVTLAPRGWTVLALTSAAAFAVTSLLL